MSKFLCSGAIEFPADKMDIVASVLRKHGLEDPDFKEECRVKGEKATYFLEESYGMLFDKDTFKNAFLELLSQGIYMVVNIVYSAANGTGGDYGLRTRNGMIYDLTPDEVTIWNADTEDLLKELEERGALGNVKPVQPDDEPEFIGRLVDIVEDFLSEKDVMIDNPERDEDDVEDAAIIYGDDYDWLADEFRYVMRAYHFLGNKKIIKS